MRIALRPRRPAPAEFSWHPAQLALLPPVGERRARAVAIIVAAQLVVALPFLFIDPTSVRGVPGPVMIVLCLVASFLLGPGLGMAVTAFGAALVVATIDANPIAVALVWIPVAGLSGLLGKHVRQAERIRRDVLEELRGGLIALSRDPEIGSMRIVTRYVPAEQAQVLAGDFYGVLPSRRGGVTVMVGDVAGHGPPAAAIATHLRAAWRALTLYGASDADVMASLNDALLAEQLRSPAVAFATICIVSIDLSDSSASVVVAGHPPPILITAGAARECSIEPAVPIGLSADRPWVPQDVQLPDPPWTLLAYTDGLVEGYVGGQRPLGIERLLPILARQGPFASQSDADGVIGQIEALNDGPFGDDIVVVGVSNTTAVTPKVAAVTAGSAESG